jgi:hypothetical protein
MSGKRAARHAQTAGARRGLLIGVAAVVGAAAVAVIVALGWLPGADDGKPADDAASSTSSDGDTRASSSPSSATGSDRGDRDASPATLRACAASVNSAERAVTVAGTGVGHWRRHVKARTDMLEGRISEKRMHAIWARTKAAGPGDQKRFDEAMRASDRLSRCGRMRGVPATDRTMADHCRERARAATRALSSGEAAMKDWRVHLANMAKYAHNKMSASMAQDRWVRAWRNAPKNISRFRAARATLNGAPRCSAVAS